MHPRFRARNSKPHGRMPIFISTLHEREKPCTSDVRWQKRVTRQCLQIGRSQCAEAMRSKPVRYPAWSDITMIMRPAMRNLRRRRLQAQ
eukprot:3500043-Pyramimonas_sp.AAC.1